MSQPPTSPHAGYPPNTGENSGSALPALVVINDPTTHISDQAASTSNAEDENGYAAPTDGEYNTDDSEVDEPDEDSDEDTSSDESSSRSSSASPDLPMAAEDLTYRIQVLESTLQDHQESGYLSESDTDPDSDDEVEPREFSTCAICSRRLAKMCLYPCEHSLCSPCLIGMWWAKITMPHHWPEEINCPFCRSVCGDVTDGEGVALSVLLWVLLDSKNAMSRLRAEEVGVGEPATVRPLLLQMRTPLG